MKKNSYLLFFAFIALLVNVISCGTTKMYDSSKQPAKNIVILYSEASMTGLGSWMWAAIGSIDGKRAGGGRIYDSMRRFKKYEILPGKHVIGAHLVTFHHSGSGDYEKFPKYLKFEATAGHVYVIRVVKKPDGFWGKPVIMDKTSNKLL